MRAFRGVMGVVLAVASAISCSAGSNGTTSGGPGTGATYVCLYTETTSYKCGSTGNGSNPPTDECDAKVTSLDACKAAHAGGQKTSTSGGETCIDSWTDSDYRWVPGPCGGTGASSSGGSSSSSSGGSSSGSSGTSSSSSGGSACSQGSNACTTCLGSACCAQVEACASDATCVAFESCFDACFTGPGSGTSCASSCISKNGDAKVQALVNCGAGTCTACK